jgi:Tfp pilus assembly protein FimT
VTVAAIAVPSLKNTVDGQRLGIDARAVEREMQLARLSAVTTNRPIRLRFNCPSVGYYRRVELIGSVNNPNTNDDADNRAAVRCNDVTYPFPAADNDPITKPNNDGPKMQLNSKVTFTSTQTLEFWPNGTVHVYNSAAQAWPSVGSSPVNIILTSAGVNRSVTVNVLGKTQIQ